MSLCPANELLFIPYVYTSMTWLFAATLLFTTPTDSLPADSTKQVQLNLRQTMQLPQLPKRHSGDLKYHYRQGFFCDFEDRISRNKKFKIDLGIGD